MNIIKNNFYGLIGFVLGIIIFLYPMIFINHDLYPGGLDDPLFINYVLEHGYLFVNGVEIHKNFWNMPIFYPNENTLAYSDVLLGAMATYIPIRFFIDNPQRCMQIWITLSCSLNYVSMYFLLKNFKFNQLSSAVGAFIFAFSLTVSSISIGHPQFLTNYITILALLCFFKIGKNNTKTKNNILFVLLALLISLQFWTAYYLGFFITYSIFIILIFSLVFKKSRKKLLDFMKFYRPCIVNSALVLIYTLLPLAWHYISVKGKFEYSKDLLFNPIYLIVSNGDLDSLFVNIDVDSGEFILGIGVFCTIIAIISLCLNKKYRFFFFVFFVIIFLSFGWENLYYFIYKYFPGACVIRTPSRCIYIFLPIFSYLIADFLDKIKTKIILFFIILLIVLEQIPNYEQNFLYTISEHKKRVAKYSIPEHCKVIAGNIPYKPIEPYLLDIMWLATYNNVYTINGYSGYMPYIDKSKIENLCEFDVPKIDMKH